MAKHDQRALPTKWRNIMKRFIAALVAVLSATVGLAVAQAPAQTVLAGPGDHHVCC
jgi:hypothetical protein